MIISLVNQKGGTGKTTTAINIASCFAKKGHDILLIDADPQGSVLQWKSIVDNKTIDVVHRPQATLHNDIERLSKNYWHTIVDTPPATGDITRSALVVSNLAIVPISPSPLDIWSSKETINLIKEARKHNRKLSSKLLISKKIIGTRIGREAREALEAYRLKIFNTEIGQRIAYVEAMISGLSVIQFQPKSEAANEIISLCDEITK